MDYVEEYRLIESESPEYPARLNEIPDPPGLLYAMGREMAASPCVAIMGARLPSGPCYRAAKQLASDLASGAVTVVAGMATGIQSAAHEGALQAGGQTIAVLGCGPDICFPESNSHIYCAIAEGGTLLSQYPPGTPPWRSHFAARTRVIIGMCDGVVLIEGGASSESAVLAKRFARELFVLSGAMNSRRSNGNHALVRAGAREVTSADEVIECISSDAVGLREPRVRVERPAARPIVVDLEDLTEEEKRVLAVVGDEPILLDHISRTTEMLISEAAQVLMRLEVRGLVARNLGGRFVRSSPADYSALGNHSGMGHSAVADRAAKLRRAHIYRRYDTSEKEGI